jgi:ribonuclease PH
MESIESMRPDHRLNNQIRPVTIIPNFVIYPEGSVLISQGNTRVLCNVGFENGVPRWMQMQNKPGGWLTAEYAMLPQSTNTRTARENNGFSARSQEIRRLIGRSLRASIDLTSLGPITILIDCDVLQADGGTRTASINGSYIALVFAIQRLLQKNVLSKNPLLSPVAAISAGIVDGEPRLDLCYLEDASAEADMNVVMNSEGNIIELQISAEKATIERKLFDQLLELSESGINELFKIQRSILG